MTWILVLIVTAIGGGTDGGAAVRVAEITGFTEASCRAAAAKIQGIGTFLIRENGPYKFGQTKTVAVCVQK